MMSASSMPSRMFGLLSIYIAVVTLLLPDLAIGARQGQKKKTSQPPPSRTSIHRSSSASDVPKPRKAKHAYLQTKRLVTEESTKFDDAPEGVTIPNTAGKTSESFLQAEKAKRSITAVEKAARLSDGEDVEGVQADSYCAETVEKENGGLVELVSMSAPANNLPAETAAKFAVDPFANLEDPSDASSENANSETTADNHVAPSDNSAEIEEVGSRAAEHAQSDTTAAPRQYPIISAILQLAVCAIMSKCIMTFYLRTDEQEEHEREPAQKIIRSSHGAYRQELGVAVQNDDAAQVAMLLQKGADLDGKDDWGCSALHTGSSSGSMRAARVLVEHGASVNAQEDWEETPLHLAARHGHFELCQLLLDNGANVNAVDLDGQTPLVGAARAGHERVLDLLLTHGGGAGGMPEAELPPLLQAALFSRMMQ